MLSKLTIKNGGVSKSNQKYLIFLTVIALAFFSFSVLRGSLIKISDIHKKTADQKKVLAGLEKKLAYLQSLDKNTLLKQTASLESVFPSKKPVMSLINSLKAVAQENNVSYAGIRLNPGEIENNTDDNKKLSNQGKESGSNLENFYLNVNLVGTLDSIFSFVDQLDLTAPLVSINSLDIGSLDTEEEESFVKASIGITVFYQAPPVNIGAIDTPLKEFSGEDEEAFAILDDYVIYPEVKILPDSRVGKDNFFQN